MKTFTKIILALVSNLTVATAPICGQSIFTKITDTANPIVTFVPTGGYSGASWVDCDNDGDLDLFTNSEFLFRNDGNGVFVEIPQAQHGIDSGRLPGELADGHTWGDFNNDGWLDVYMANSHSALFKNNGLGANGNVSFSKVEAIVSTNVAAWAAAFGDYDEDGWLDLATTHPCGFLGACQTNRLFKSDGNGDFVSVNGDISTGFDAYTVGSWSDFDQDGDLDFFIGSGEVSQLSPDNIYFNQLSQTGSADLVKSDCPLVCTEPRDGQNWNWIDYDNDGDFDGFVTNYGKANDFYRNDAGTFHKLTDSDLGCDLATFFLTNWLTNVWEDFDNDGDLDLFLGSDSPQPDFLYLNDGPDNMVGSTFTKTSDAFNFNGATRGVSAGDYDQDGSVDLFVSGGGPAGKSLFRNNGNQNQWLHLNLVGTTSNRSAIGAKVRAKATVNGESSWQIREVSSQNSFCGANSLTVHFGLGDATFVDTIVVEWPLGLTETYALLDTNQTCTVIEGQGIDCLTVTAAGEIKKNEATYFDVSPNPVTGGQLKINWKFDQAQEVRVAIVGLDGRKIWEKSFSNASENQTVVNTEKFFSGMYVVKITAGEAVLTKAFVITN